jgi:hypothetical protein
MKLTALIVDHEQPAGVAHLILCGSSDFFIPLAEQAE